MKKCSLLVILIIILMSTAPAAKGQCSICTRTAQQLGERPAKALNTGIIYLAFAPMAICGIIGYRWWRSQSND